MRQTELAVRADKDAPHDAESKNAELLTRGGFIQKEMAGVYSYLPMGLKVLRKIEQIVREEMESVRAQQVLMPALTPLKNWQQTGRADVDISYRPTDNTVLGWSHEEIVTPMAANLIRSHRDLPKCLFQIQTKFRNEPRAKSGLLRGREFIMKDAYSFHATKEDFDEYYEQMSEAYFRVYDRCGIKAYRIEAEGGEFTKKISHEFAVITPAGEDIMIYCTKCRFAQNLEIVDSIKKGDSCPKCSSVLDEAKCVEVGNIFDLGSKYSDAFKFTFTDSDGQEKPVIMGCYGIGISRLMGTIVEAAHDGNGIVWPKTVASFQIHIVSLREDEAAQKIAYDLEQEGYEVLFDDRDETPGKKFADSDLFGIPLRIVVSKRTLETGSVELKDRASGETHTVAIHEVPHTVWDFFTTAAKQ